MAEWRVMRKEHCSCVQMHYPKCNLCDGQGMMEHPDWQATAESLRARVAALEKDGAANFAGLKVYKREVDRVLLAHQASQIHSAVARAIDATLKGASHG